MPTLYTFGDSFSEDFEIFSESRFSGTLRYKYIHEFLNGKIPKSFGQNLSEKLNYNYICGAGIYGYPNEGNCNQSMFNNFFMSAPKIQENDIVFFGYTSPLRFKWYNPKYDRLVSILPNQFIQDVSSEELKAMEIYMVNRDKKAYAEEYIKLEILIKEFAKSRNFKVFFWSNEDLIYKNLENHVLNNSNWLMSNEIVNSSYNIYHILKKNKGYNILHETKGLNSDSHFGETAHFVLSELFYNELINKNLI